MPGGRQHGPPVVATGQLLARSQYHLLLGQAERSAEPAARAVVKKPVGAPGIAARRVSGDGVAPGSGARFGDDGVGDRPLLGAAGVADPGGAALGRAAVPAAGALPGIVVPRAV